jgi:uncharacterized protein (DUF433 family)
MIIAFAESPENRDNTPMHQLDRITHDPAVMGGKPCLRGMRVSVGMILGQIAAGQSFEQLLADYPYL